MNRLAYLREIRNKGWRNSDLFAEAHAREEMRQALRRELRVHTGQRSLGHLVGVGRSVLRKFLEMRSIPLPEHMLRIRDWAADRPHVDVPLGAVCLAALAEDLPPAERYAARLRIAGVLAEIYASSEQEVPAWIVYELGDRR